LNTIRVGLEFECRKRKNCMVVNFIP
jgi:hypothetical protein